MDLNGHTMFMKVKDTKGGSVIATSHRVWDGQRFAAAQQQRYAEVDEKEKQPGRHQVSVIDQAEYQAITGKRG